MLSGWDSGVRVREERGLLEADCDWAWGNYDEGESWVTILMSHGYCMIFRDAHFTDSLTQSTEWYSWQDLVISPDSPLLCGTVKAIY